MGRDGTKTKNKILSESKSLVFKNGFSGTSIDQILEKTGITKGAFFYHFKTKNALAKALIEEYANEDMNHMNYVLEKTESLMGDPLHRLLQFIQEFIDMMSDITEPPSCLYASYVNEPNYFSEEILTSVSDSILSWRKTFEYLLGNVMKECEKKINVDLVSLSDLFTVVFEGSFVVSKSLNDPSLTARQLKLLKNYFQLLFEVEK